jgi:hypothetical protein
MRNLISPAPENENAPHSNWESSPWLPEERMVMELQSSEPALELSEDNVVDIVDVEESSGIIRAF